MLAFWRSRLNRMVKVSITRDAMWILATSGNEKKDSLPLQWHPELHYWGIIMQFSRNCIPCPSRGTE